tara:strand:- start:725 stop:1972 length:1248 start_codon:yes stop_codon:yes gene_type:complete
MNLISALALSILLLPLSPLAAQVSYQLGAGFHVESPYSYDAAAPFELQVGGLAISRQGEVIINEGGEVRIHREEGPLVLATFSPGVFGSFLVMDPDGRSVWFAESSEHNVYRIALETGGAELVDRIEFNFDMAFAPAGAPGEFAGKGFITGLGNSPENSLWLLDDDPGQPNIEIISGISPFSGPVTFDDKGNLYLVTSGLTDSRTGLPAEKLVRFSAGQLAEAISGNTLQSSDGDILRTEMAGLYNLTWLDGRLYGTNLGFQSGGGSIDVIDPERGFTQTSFARLELDGETGGSMIFLSAKTGPAGFEPGSGQAGGTLLASYGNYVDVSGLSLFTPELFFLRGDSNHDNEVDISDAVSIISYLFLDGLAPQPGQAADINADGALDLADAVYLLNFLYRGGPQPPAPFPQTGPSPR